MSKLLYLDNANNNKDSTGSCRSNASVFYRKIRNPSSVYSFAAANKEVINQQRCNR